MCSINTASNYKEEDYLMLSGIQHFYFCKRQWALIHIEQQWKESQATMEGNILHERVDDAFELESRGNVFVSRAVPVSSKALGLSGILDALEFHEDDSGIEIEGKKGTWRLNVVEYKRGKKKKDHRDIVQLTAQVMCLEEMFQCHMHTSDLFYHQTKKRETVPITEALRSEVKSFAAEMHRLYEKQITPEAESYKNCTQCSLYDLCLPRITKKRKNIKNYIESNLRSEEEHA